MITVHEEGFRYILSVDIFIYFSKDSVRCQTFLFLLSYIFPAQQTTINKTRKKLLYTVANPARGLLNREKNKNKKSGSAPPPPPARCSFGEKIKK